MTIMRSVIVDNKFGERYRIVVRKHTNIEILIDYGYPYSIKIENVNPDAFDLNCRILLYDDWQTAYKRQKELADEYREIEPHVWNI